MPARGLIARYRAERELTSSMTGALANLVSRSGFMKRHLTIRRLLLNLLYDPPGSVLYRRALRNVERLLAEKATPCPRRGEAPSRLVVNQATDYWRRDGTCSYCGSLRPSLLFEAIEAGARIDPTDKSWKAYVEGPEAPKTRGAAKVYFQHLSVADRKRFVDLLNSGGIKLGYPGRFYVLPFFVKQPNLAP